ncbi:MAG: hypothetical protein KDB26_12415 [Microthrixaceae bacterium]|nr:hypothetical protein [Microthrixaceae bacterium]
MHDATFANAHVTSLNGWRCGGAGAKLAGMDENAETVTELSADTGGRWLVTTEHSEHIFDLDALTYTRLPGAGRGRFIGDGKPLRLFSVEQFPKVGGHFRIELFDCVPSGLILWRVSSPITRIERLVDGE